MLRVHISSPQSNSSGRFVELHAPSSQVFSNVTLRILEEWKDGGWLAFANKPSEVVEIRERGMHMLSPKRVEMVTWEKGTVQNAVIYRNKSRFMLEI